jgi:hypothetical protein
MIAAYYTVPELKAHYPLGLFDRVDQAKKACVNAARRMKSVTFTAADFKWKEYTTEDSADFYYGVASVRSGKVGFDFFVQRLVPVA